MAVIAVGITSLMTPLLAQVESYAQPAYVASIKPNNGAPGEYSTTPGRVVARNVTAKFLVAIAYGLQPFQISGGPGWVDSDRFDVEARLEDAKSNSGQEGLMMKSLLANRFKLVLHKDAQQSSVYALVVGGKGPKIKASADQTPGAGMSPLGSMRVGATSLVGMGVPLGLFASLLGTRLGQTVIDQTNLPGRYDIDLRWTPDTTEPPPSANVDPKDVLRQPDTSGPSVFTAIQEQLGLKLQLTKGFSGFLIIDHLERPDTN
jgi:uncharacterized protein (TIGR03435 family)